MDRWNAFESAVTMPLMAPGGKLSEVELHKLLGAYQWEAISRVLGVPTQDIATEQGERLYASFINVELDFGPRHGPDRFGEGTPLFVMNRVRTYAHRFVEGFFVLDDRPIPEADLRHVTTREALESCGRPYAYYTNAFIARAGGNSLLRVFKPVGMDGVEDALKETPAGIRDHARVQATGAVEGFGDDAFPLTASVDAPLRYPLVPESDLNGAGLVYFARYMAVTSYAERVYGEERLAPPLSNLLIESLSTERRRIYYFANANPKDAVDVVVRASLVPPGKFPEPTTARPYRTPFKLVFRMDLYRASDKVLMATSLVRKALNIAASAKGVLNEADRFLAAVVKTGSR